MSAPATDRARRRNRIQNLSIVLLSLSAILLFASLPLFGAFSDRSLLALARDRLHQEKASVGTDTVSALRLAFPVRMVYTNEFARLGTDGLTTLSDEFEYAGTYLGEALGSAGGASLISETAFLSALRGEGLYFDFSGVLPVDVLASLLGIPATDPGIAAVRRALLSPASGDDALLYVQDGTAQYYRFTTVVSSLALKDFLASQSGETADFAFLLGPTAAQLSPYTIVLSDPPPRGVLAASNPLVSAEESFLRSAGFNPHSENRFTEASGTVIVREVTSTLYLRPGGVVDYQGWDSAPDPLYSVSAAVPGSPTPSEAAAAAQTLISTLLRGLLGDAVLCMRGVTETDTGYEITFDLMANGVPVRFSDGSHAAVVSVEGGRITAFSLHARRYTVTEETTPLLPFSLSSAVARVWDEAELIIAYVDSGGERVPPVWIAE